MLRSRSFLLAAFVGILAVLGVGGLTGAASAHGFTTVVYANVTAASPGVVRVRLGLEYDLMLVSVASAEKDDPFYRAGQPAWDDADFATMAKVVEEHRASIAAYLAKRFTITYAGRACVPSVRPGVTAAMRKEQGVPYATLVADYRCATDADADVLKTGHVIASTMFADSEGFVTGAKTIVTYDLDGRSGSAALDDQHASFSTKQSTRERFTEFWRLGAEHLLTGLDHLLFLTALIVGSRKLREVVLAATTFTLAHSTTLMLAAFGVVHVSSDVVEPLIALSIAATAAWYLWRVWRRREHVTDLDVTSTSHLALDRAGWSRLVVVFCFGLVHGLGFAGALGIDHAWSWSLLWSLVVFNVGLESVQLSLIVVIFPVLVLLRRRSPVVAMWVTAAIALVVALIGLVWFGQRVFGFHLIGEGG